MKKYFRKSAALVLVLMSIYCTLLVYPKVLFAYEYRYKNFQIYSDRPVSVAVETIIDKVIHNLSRSELYKEGESFRIYLCNDSWRFYFFTRNKNAGGVVNLLVSSNAFIRESLIEENKIVPPNTWQYSTRDRTLAYFIAHEVTHSMQRNADPLIIFKTPSFVLEGYADYIAKFATYDFEKYQAMYLDNDALMNPKNGLYNRYHLYIAYLIDQQGMSFREILRAPPDLEMTLGQLRISSKSAI